MHIQGVQKQLREFAAARDWQSFHSPKNLAMALMVEAAELLELFQWLTTEQSHTLTQCPVDKEKVEDEIADVMLYLLQLADRTGVDLESAVRQKLTKNAVKYPAKHLEPALSKPKVHVLVDCENVCPDSAALKLLEPAVTDVWLFHAPAQRLDVEHHQKAFGANSVTLVERTGTGRNALDFQLSYYAGYLMARQPEARFVVVSNDKGYDPMLEHARKLDFQAQRCGYQKPPVTQTTVPKPVARKKEAKTAASKAAGRVEGSSKNSSIQLDKAAVPRTAVAPSAAQIAHRMHKDLKQMAAQQRPELWQALERLALSHITQPMAEPLALAHKACRLLMLRRIVAQDVHTGQLHYDLALRVDTSTNAAHTALVAAPMPVVPMEINQAQLCVQVPLLGPAKMQGSPATNDKRSLKSSTLKIQSALQKTKANRPVQRESLMWWIHNQLDHPLPVTVTAEKVCAALQSQQWVKIARSGVVSYPQWDTDATLPIKPLLSAMPTKAVTKKPVAKPKAAVKKSAIAQQQATAKKQAAARKQPADKKQAVTKQAAAKKRFQCL